MGVRRVAGHQVVFPGLKWPKNACQNGSMVLRGVPTCRFFSSSLVISRHLSSCFVHRPNPLVSESGKRGLITQGRGKHPSDPLPETLFDPATYGAFSLPFGSALSFPAEDIGTDQTNPAL